MKAAIYIVLLIVLSLAAIFFFIRSIDAAIEIDDLKSQIHLQQEGIQFIQTVANDAFSSCKTSVEQFEVTAKKMDMQLCGKEKMRWLVHLGLRSKVHVLRKLSKWGCSITQVFRQPHHRALFGYPGSIIPIIFMPDILMLKYKNGHQFTRRSSITEHRNFGQRKTAVRPRRFNLAKTGSGTCLYNSSHGV